MDGKVEYGDAEESFSTTLESISQVSVSLYDSFNSPPLVSKVSFSLNAEEKSVFTSTPDFITEDSGGCQVHSSDSVVKKSRIRRRECHHVHYSGDLDRINMTSDKLKKRNKKRRRMSLLQSISTDDIDSEEVHLDTLENHLFPDISFSESELSYSQSKFSTMKETDFRWSKLHGVSYSGGKCDFSGDVLDINRSINHPKRSIFRQKRRDWYLGRRSRQHSIIHHSGLWWSCIRRFLILIIAFLVRKVVRKVTRCVGLVLSVVPRSSFKIVSVPIVFIFKMHLYMYSFVKRNVIHVYSKVLGLFFTSSRNTIKENEKIKCSCFCFCWILLILALLSALFVGYYEEGEFQRSIIPIPNPHKNGIANAYPFYIDAENSRIPAWHIYPNLLVSSVVHPVKKSMNDMSPVILYLKHEGGPGAPRLKSVYQALSSLGYHIIVLTDIPSQHEILKSWKWIKSQTNATAYLWGYGISAATLTVTAKLFCKDLIPPNGVIISRYACNGDSHHSMEIWSCSCVLSSNGNNGTDFRYNHVKCPVTLNNYDVNDIYSQVVICIETVNKGIK